MKDTNRKSMLTLFCKVNCSFLINGFYPKVVGVSYFFVEVS